MLERGVWGDGGLGEGVVYVDVCVCRCVSVCMMSRTTSQNTISYVFVCRRMCVSMCVFGSMIMKAAQ